MAEGNGATELMLGLSIEFGRLVGMVNDPVDCTILLGQIITDEQTRLFTLLFGLAAFSGGIVLMFRHQRSYRNAGRKKADERMRRFEYRKFRRRMTASSMISAIGVMMASLYWATEPRAFAVLITLVLTTLLGVLGLGLLDLMSVGLQQISQPNEEARKALVEEHLKRRQQKTDD